MEKNFSSTTTVKINHEAAKEVQHDLPQSYGKTESFLLPKDPFWMFLFWDIVKETYQTVIDKHGRDIFNESKSVVRVYDITEVSDFNGNNANNFFDVSVVLDAGSWYINVPQSGRKYVCDIGIITPQGAFILLSRSNSTVLPGGRISNVIDEKWMMVEGQYQKLLQLSGAEKWGAGAGSSEKLQHFLSQRWKMFELEGAPSSHIFSWSSHAAFPQPPITEDEDIWLKADCELIVYGQASANARVTINDKPLQLNPDGTFSLRYSLQAGGEVTVPIKARHHRKEEKKKAITIKARRDKEV